MLENSVKTEINKLLGSGEKIVWEGKPHFSSYYVNHIFGLLTGFLALIIFLAFVFQFIAIFFKLLAGNPDNFVRESVPLILISFLVASGIVIFYQFFNIYFKGKATYFFITNRRVIIKELSNLEFFDLDKVNKIDFNLGIIDRSFFIEVGTLEFQYPSDITNKNPDLRYAKYYISSIENVSKVFDILKNEASNLNSKVEFRNEQTPERIFSLVNFHLDSDEKILWKDEGNYNLYNSKAGLLFILLIPFFGIYMGLVITTIRDFSLNSSYLTFLYIFLIIILTYVFKYLLSNAYEASNFVVAFYISNKKLFFMKNVGSRYPVYAPFMCEISQITSLENLNEKKEGFSKYRVSSKFYEISFSNKFYKILMKHRDIYLDEKGLQILTKLIKEQATAAKIKL